MKEQLYNYADYHDIKRSINQSTCIRCSAMNLYDYSILLKYLNKNYGFLNKVLIFVHTVSIDVCMFPTVLATVN